ncbi:ATP synthase F1 subunit gamma [Mycoplasmopsis iners]|uniref:ATP synthase F1 subunit gamma n=1 Tax=Mycoplasmopsis iners TaxID=76630 RepID=UPI0004977F5A|nr:ATP synthase F1 subunit gamma [Mycoplasmopsis iners]
MAGLQTIKNRINAVKAIRKITHAMELVASSKLKKARTEYESVQSYVSVVNEAFYGILTHMTEQEIKNLFVPRQTNSKLYIVLTGDFGLAGSYNSSVIKLAKKTIKKEDKLIIIGNKGANALKPIFNEQVLNIFHSDETIDHYKLMQLIMTEAYKLYLDKQVDSIHIIYSKYINNLVQQEFEEKIFPFDHLIDDCYQELTQSINTAKSQVEFEPSARRVFSEAIPLFISAQIYKAYSSSKLSELASRRSAMETATDNANNLIEDLQIKYNRRRQSNITQELNEIVAGANAV